MSPSTIRNISMHLKPHVSTDVMSECEKVMEFVVDVLV